MLERMNRNLLEGHLRAAEGHVALGERHIARQREIISHLRTSGGDPTIALELLRQFEIAQRMHRAERDRLQLELLNLVGKTNHLPADHDRARLADLLGVLVNAAVEYADGKARAAFYRADPAETKLHHVVGMSPAYALFVDGFSIGADSLACGLAAATRKAVVTPNVFHEPRWKNWAWLADQFGYQACWSFPLVGPAGKALGSFAMYYPHPREATPRDLEMASLLSRTAANIVSSH